MADSTLYNDCLSTSSSSIACVTGSTGTFTSSSGGAIPSATTVTIPSGTAAGTYSVIVYSGGSSIVSSATYTVNPSVTQSITLTVGETGATTATFTLSGCSITPTSIPGNGAAQTVTATPMCTITITVPTAGANTRYMFSGGVTTTSVTTCLTAPCTAFSQLYYY